jgi:hypothetical protein
MDRHESKANYSLHANHPDKCDVVSESHFTIKGATSRAVELLQVGYKVEIASSTVVETMGPSLPVGVQRFTNSR